MLFLEVKQFENRLRFNKVRAKKERGSHFLVHFVLGMLFSVNLLTS